MDERVKGLDPRGDLIGAARELARRAHDGQVDKLGEPYIKHVLAVTSILTTSENYLRFDSFDREIAEAAALLHDTLEDTTLDPMDMIKAGFPGAVVTTVVTLTHMPHEPRSQYYERILTNPIAVAVKLADIAHNSDPERLNKIADTEVRERLSRKYREAWATLDGGAGAWPAPA